MTQFFGEFFKLHFGGYKSILSCNWSFYKTHLQRICPVQYNYTITCRTFWCSFYSFHGDFYSFMLINEAITDSYFSFTKLNYNEINIQRYKKHVQIHNIILKVIELNRCFIKISFNQNFRGRVLENMLPKDLGFFFLFVALQCSLFEKTQFLRSVCP